MRPRPGSGSPATRPAGLYVQLRGTEAGTEDIQVARLGTIPLCAPAKSGEGPARRQEAAPAHRKPERAAGAAFIIVILAPGGTSCSIPFSGTAPLGSTASARPPVHREIETCISICCRRRGAYFSHSAPAGGFAGRRSDRREAPRVAIASVLERLGLITLVEMLFDAKMKVIRRRCGPKGVAARLGGSCSHLSSSGRSRKGRETPQTNGGRLARRNATKKLTLIDEVRAEMRRSWRTRARIVVVRSIWQVAVSDIITGNTGPRTKSPSRTPASDARRRVEARRGDGAREARRHSRAAQSLIGSLGARGAAGKTLIFAEVRRSPAKRMWPTAARSD